MSGSGRLVGGVGITIVGWNTGGALVGVTAPIGWLVDVALFGAGYPLVVTGLGAAAVGRSPAWVGCCAAVVGSC